jgi:HlyD family secretion protein
MSIANWLTAASVVLSAFARFWERQPPGEPRHQPARTAPRPPRIMRGYLILGAACLCGRALAQADDVGADGRQPRRTSAPIQADTVPVHLVMPGKLRFTVVERAIVEPCWVAREYCRLKGSTPISWILPEGAKVLAGQPICQLATKNESGLIFASLSGILVHPPEFDRPDGQPIDEFGATVRYGQEIFTIVDDHGPMQLDVKVHERAIDQMERGLKARIKFDAFPGALLTGTVSEVAVLPDPVCMFVGWVKTYTAKVQIGHAPAGLRPGMTAEVEIFANDLENVLSVPVEAVIHDDGNDRVAIQQSAGRFVWRAVTLGQSNARWVEVKEGILSGDLVATRPLGLLSGPGRFQSRARVRAQARGMGAGIAPMSKKIERD